MWMRVRFLLCPALQRREEVNIIAVCKATTTISLWLRFRPYATIPGQSAKGLVCVEKWKSHGGILLQVRVLPHASFVGDCSANLS